MGIQCFRIIFIWIVITVIASTRIQRSTSSTSSWRRENESRLPDSLVPRSQSVEEMLRHYQVKLARLGNLKIEPKVWIGASAPNDPSGIEDAALSKRKHRPFHLHRRIRSQDEAFQDEACKTNRYWKQINVTRNIFGDEVRIIHTEEYRQFTFVYECTRERERCNGTRAELQTACEMRKGWAFMMYNKTVSGSNIVEWNYVEVPHHCSCKIIPTRNPFILK